jgi:hypothetical protein
MALIMSGRKIIKGLEQALAHARGDLKRTKKKPMTCREAGRAYAKIIYKIKADGRRENARKRRAERAERRRAKFKIV